MPLLFPPYWPLFSFPPLIYPPGLLPNSDASGRSRDGQPRPWTGFVNNLKEYFMRTLKGLDETHMPLQPTSKKIKTLLSAPVIHDGCLVKNNYTQQVLLWASIRASPDCGPDISAFILIRIEYIWKTNCTIVVLRASIRVCPVCSQDISVVTLIRIKIHLNHSQFAHQ